MNLEVPVSLLADSLSLSLPLPSSQISVQLSRSLSPRDSAGPTQPTGSTLSLELPTPSPLFLLTTTTTHRQTTGTPLTTHTGHRGTVLTTYNPGTTHTRHNLGVYLAESLTSVTRCRKKAALITSQGSTHHDHPAMLVRPSCQQFPHCQL